MIWVRKTENEYGGYVDQNGARVTVEWCCCMVTPDGTGPADYRYERHESIDAACSAWGLTPYVIPEVQAEVIDAEVIEENS